MSDRLSDNAARIANEETAALVGAHPGVARAARPRRRSTCPTAWRRRSTPTIRTRSTSSAGRARTCGTSTAPSTSTSTAASASTSSATRTRRSSRRSSTRRAPAPTSPPPRPTTVALAEELCRRFNLDVGALRQLRHRGDDGRHPHRPRRHRAREDPEDRGLVPRSPRHGDVLGGPQRRRDGRARPARVDADVEGHPGGPRRLHARRAVQRRRRARPHAHRPRERDRLPDHGAGDDEHRRRACPSPATSRPRATCAPSTASC